MKKAVIEYGGLQYLVAEGDVITVNYVGEGKKKIECTPVMLVDGKSSVIDSAELKDVKVTASVENELFKGDKVVALRYKAKKRVNTKRGHRQSLSKLKIATIK